jgi:hypothetical protein
MAGIKILSTKLNGLLRSINKNTATDIVSVALFLRKNSKMAGADTRLLPA